MKVSMESVLFLSDFNTSTEMFQTSVKIPNTKFHEDPSCRSLCSMQAGRQVDKWIAILKLMFPFYNYFVNTSTKWVTP